MKKILGIISVFLMLFILGNLTAVQAKTEVSLVKDKNDWYVMKTDEFLSLTGETKLILAITFENEVIVSKGFEKYGVAVPADINIVKNTVSIIPKKKLDDGFPYTLKIITASQKKFILNIRAKASKAVTKSDVDNNGNTLVDIYVNDKKMGLFNGLPIQLGRVQTIVPIQPIVEAMGDSYSVSGNGFEIATIKMRDGRTVIVGDGTGMANVDGKHVPIERITVNGKDYPYGFTSSVWNSYVVVPVAFFNEVLGYSVVVMDNPDTIYIGSAPPKSASVGEFTVPKKNVPKNGVKYGMTDAEYKEAQKHYSKSVWKELLDFSLLTGTAGKDVDKNIDWVYTNLPFDGASYSPSSFRNSTALWFVKDPLDIQEASLTVRDWEYAVWGLDYIFDSLPNRPEFEVHYLDPNPRYVAKAVLKFFFPHNYEKIYKLVDDMHKGKNMESMDKYLFYPEDNRYVFIINHGGCEINIGKLGVKKGRKY